jgi:hypothetical protein
VCVRACARALACVCVKFIVGLIKPELSFGHIHLHAPLSVAVNENRKQETMTANKDCSSRFAVL